MKILLVYYLYEDAGSATDVHHYVRAAKELGHEIVVYGPPNPKSAFPWTMDLDGVDGVAFIFEWTQMLKHGDKLDVARILSRVPRNRRIVIDCDGGYNERLNVEGDFNHKSDADSATWLETAECLADKIFQPTARPRRKNVGTFYFHGYSETWERPLDLANRPLGMTYVGHAKFRWGPMLRVLSAIEKVRDVVGPIKIVGHGWDQMPEWAEGMGLLDAYFTDKDHLKRMGVEIVPPIPFTQVIDWMSSAVMNPVIYRPLFRELGFVTCRTFETPAAGTVSLFGLDADYVRETFGEAALELVLPEREPEAKVLDIFGDRAKYAKLVGEIRAHMRAHHGFHDRVRELVRHIEA